MTIHTLFSSNETRQQVFDTLVTLAKSNKQLLLVYREGRRADDDFIKRPLEITPQSFERIQYSSEWRIFIDSKYGQQASLALHFKRDVLDQTMINDGEINVAVPFSLKLNIWLNELGFSLLNLLSKSKGKHGLDMEKGDAINCKNKDIKSKRRYVDKSGS